MMLDFAPREHYTAEDLVELIRYSVRPAARVPMG